MQRHKCLVNVPDVIETGQKCLIFECLFGLKPIHVKIYFYLLQGKRTIKQIASFIDRDRTTAVRLIQVLLKAGFVERHEETLENGGTRYLYSAISQDTIKQNLLEAIKDIEQSIKAFLQKDWRTMPD
ncbi:MAG: helix-turn-helix domain-containing protein [Candidatus Heimdallarchaeaceae archaeon]